MQSLEQIVSLLLIVLMIIFLGNLIYLDIRNLLPCLCCLGILIGFCGLGGFEDDG